MESYGERRQIAFSNFDAIKAFASVQKTFAPSKAQTPKEHSAGEDADVLASGVDYRAELLNITRALPPAGFERLCQRLLRESGFQQVVVTGRAGDGGINGVGVLQLNPFVTFNVLFQCKLTKAR